MQAACLHWTCDQATGANVASAHDRRGKHTARSRCYEPSTAHRLGGIYLHVGPSARGKQMKSRNHKLGMALAFTGVTLLASCGGGGGSGNTSVNVKPSFVIGAIGSQSYPGTTDDLLTAGLGKSGLAGTAPSFADPANPTAAELRRSTIYVNYRAIVDVAPNGGYGTLYGPNVDISGNPTSGE